MLMRQIMNLVNVDRMTVRGFCDIFSRFDASEETTTDRSDMMRMMYGDPIKDAKRGLEVERLEAEIEKIRAEIDKMRAEAANLSRS